MSNPTTPFSWQMPTATDLVTDLPADFEVFGQAVATSMADLLGGTSGQILAKNSNTDMDFVWVANDVGDITAVTAGTGISGGGTSGAVTITNSMATAIDAKGDLVVGTGADTFSRLAVGTNDYFLQAASGEATGQKWGGTWSTWTPTLVQGVTVTATVAAARYMKIGKMITGQVLLVATSTGTANNNIKVTLPFAALTGNSFVITGGATVYDASTTLVYPGFSAVVDGTYFQLPVSSAIVANGGQYLGNNQFTLALASGDYVAFGFTYEVA